MLAELFPSWPFGPLGWAIKALDPLVYCEYRKSGGYEDDGVCVIFAGEMLHGMPLCEGHAELVKTAIADSGVELVKTKGPVTLKKEA